MPGGRINKTGKKTEGGRRRRGKDEGEEKVETELKTFFFPLFFFSGC